MSANNQQFGGKNFLMDDTNSASSSNGYERLEEVLFRAYDLAAKGKGHERHSVGQPFHDQPILRLQELYGIGFALGQAGKKMEEAQRMDKEAAVKELLGAITYIAAAVIHIEDRGGV